MLSGGPLVFFSYLAQLKRPQCELYMVDTILSICGHLDLTLPLHAAIFTCLIKCVGVRASTGLGRMATQIPTWHLRTT